MHSILSRCPFLMASAVSVRITPERIDRERDRNTVRYMIDELQKEVDTQKALLEEKDTVIAEKDAIIANLQAKLAEK